MAKSTHSPAPWVHDQGRCAIRYQLPIGHPERWSDDPEDDDGWRDVVNLRSACGGTDTAADVALMTAAPEILEALRRTIDAFAVYADEEEDDDQSFGEVIRAARAAIAKAEGSS